MIDYKKISRNIFIFYAVLMASVVAFVVSCELNLLPLEGLLVDVDATAMYVLEVATLFVVGIGLLAALKGFHWCLHHKVLVAESQQRANLYTSYSFVRIAILGALMLYGAFLYYATLENWGMYYGLAAFVVSFFCLPSAEGVKAELEMDSATCS